MRVNRKLIKYKWLFEPEEKTEKQRYATLQELVNESEFWLMVHSAILYGFITGDASSINIDKCIHYLEKGKRLKIFPEKGYISPGFKNNFQVTLTPNKNEQ